MKKFLLKGPLTRKFAGPAGWSIATTVVNLVATLVMLRLYGPHAFSNYIVDLAIISLTLIFFELVPSSYLVFRLQDDARWGAALGTQTILGVAISVSAIIALHFFTNYIADFSFWIFLYATASGIKRQLDLILQSSGRLSEFFLIDGVASALRLFLLVVFAWLNFYPATALWASIALSFIISQLWWFGKNVCNIKKNYKIIQKDSLRLIWKERRRYPAYYLNILLKRVRDSLAPIIAGHLILDKSTLAAFFLAYRGMAAAVSQMRIIEAIFNHRETQKELSNLGSSEKILIATGTQLMCIVASSLIILLAGVTEPSWASVIILSGLAWPSTMIMQERAKALANYKTKYISYSLIAYILILVIAVGAKNLLNIPPDWLVPTVLLIAEIFTWMILANGNRN
jgi:hypothetical protein